jgi:hypothetical protein
MSYFSLQRTNSTIEIVHRNMQFLLKIVFKSVTGGSNAVIKAAMISFLLTSNRSSVDKIATVG